MTIGRTQRLALLGGPQACPVKPKRYNPIGREELAAVTASARWGVLGIAGVLGFYVGVGGGFVWFLAYNYRHSVSTNQ